MRYVALLRGVNVGGHRKIAMADLRALAVALSLEDPITLLQSGNLVFGARKRPTDSLERWLEKETGKQLGLQTDFMVRSGDEWEKVIARNPFADAARRDPGHLVVMFLKRPVAQGAVEALSAANPGPEIIHADGREMYIVFPRGAGTSKLPALMTAARLGSPATGRNWNTVLKLRAALQG
ncbi:MAG TPA: DUF1697 domain-containing protein [Gemmatimonadaceae bacterium]